MYRLSFELVQHTSIIHFQADYQGATLRVSEVKPKLDKYLLKCFRRDKAPIPKNWLIPNQKGYKLSQDSVGKAERDKYLLLSQIGMGNKKILKGCLKDSTPHQGAKTLSVSPLVQAHIVRCR